MYVSMCNKEMIHEFDTRLLPPSLSLLLLEVRAIDYHSFAYHFNPATKKCGQGLRKGVRYIGLCSMHITGVKTTVRYREVALRYKGLML